MQTASVPLDDVIATQALRVRPPRCRDAAAEARAMEGLREAVTGSPRALLQKLAEVALELCEAHSTGVSLLEPAAAGGRQFRWYATAGVWKDLLWTTLPRDSSPCGTVLDRSATQLMIVPERHFSPLLQIRPQVAEALLVPFAVKGELVGTVWVVAHEPSRQFDRGDELVMSKLTEFAAAAYERLAVMDFEAASELARMRAGAPHAKSP